VAQVEIASGFAGISGRVTGLWDITAYRFTRIYSLRTLNSRRIVEVVCRIVFILNNEKRAWQEKCVGYLS